VLEAVRGGKIDAVASWALAEEIVEVLRRPALRRYGVTEGDIVELLLVLGPLLPDVEVAVAVRDADDAVVIAAAIAGQADVIVSGDRDLLDDVALLEWLEQRGISVLAPADALAALSGR
jgi:putative PIN family toxin of toxin-antitoxin system